MRVTWATDYFGDGNAYGYSIHNRRSREAIQRAGVVLDDDADVAVHVCPAHLFRPIAGKRNVLYMAWETPDLPRDYAHRLRAADAVAVTATFLVPAVRRAAPGVPVYLCHEGVDAAAFPFRRRTKSPGEPFRFLWIGAPNARKGWELVLQAWRVFAGDPRFELYIKTTVSETNRRIGNVVFDSRNCSQRELVALYHSAHAFLFPSFGEGFGLTLAEAMATGLPCIYTPWSSMTDLLDGSCGYPLPYHLIDAWATPGGGLVTRREKATADAVATRLAQADVPGIVTLMAQVYRGYPRAVRKGLRAARRIREQFTWDAAGRRLARIIERVVRGAEPPAAVGVD